MSNPTENGNDSRKEEILAKSRNSGRDEGLEYAQLKGNSLGMYIMIAIVIPIVTFIVFQGEVIALFAVSATLCAFVLGQCLAEYRFTKRKYHLAWTVGIAMAVMICIVFLVAKSLGQWNFLFGWLL